MPIINVHLKTFLVGVIAVMVISFGLLLAIAEPASAGAYRLDNPLSGKDGQSMTSVEDVIANIIQIVLGLTGVLALVNFVIAGTQMIFAHGNEKKIADAKENMKWTVFALVIIFSSYAAVNFVIQAIKGVL